MSLPEPIQRALKLPNGARFYKCALQVNPSNYAAKYRGAAKGVQDGQYIGEILDKCEQLDIRVLAITDHNHVGSVDAFRVLATERGISVFPGFELSSSEGVHVLCLYEPRTPVDQLQRFLGEFGIRDTDQSAGISGKTFSELLRLVRDQGGISIAAHVTQASGLLTTLHGQARIRAWRDRNLLAVQIPADVDQTPDDKRPILANENADYARDPNAGEFLALAAINAKDVAAPTDLGEPSATCWIKMSEISIEGLRQAFLDPDSRIRLNHEPAPTPHAEFRAIAWESHGFLEGAAIHFNENLNILIGGRGTGKSTIIESLRYVLNLEPIGEDARRVHEGIIKNVLKPGTKVSLLVRSPHPSPREYLLERSVPNPPTVKDLEGNVLPLKPADVLPGVEVYGQHEISELTRSKEKLTRLLERFVQKDPAAHRRKLEIRRELERSRIKILETNEELDQVDERLSALPALEETLKRFQEAGLEDRLKDQSLLVREEQILDTANERVEEIESALSTFSELATIDRAFVSGSALKELPAKAVLAELDDILARLERQLTAAVEMAESGAETARDDLAAVRKSWIVRKKKTEIDFEKILRDLQRSKVDGAEFIRLRKQIEQLRPLAARRSSLKKTHREQTDRRKNLLAEWEDAKGSEFRQLGSAANAVNKRLKGRVKVEVNFAGDKEPLFRLLKERVGGRLADIVEILDKRDPLSLVALAQACRDGKKALIEQFGFTSGQAERLCQSSQEVVMLIEEVELNTTTSLFLNVAESKDGETWRDLNQLSTGQKATAVLLLLLLESDAPLVVDQPEDDLDNRFITDGVVPRMRKEKRRRQFVFATHNANIPVLGDSELIAGLRAAGEAMAGHAVLDPDYMGSIDSQRVRKMVEDVLEGGHDAFELRRRKYGY